MATGVVRIAAVPEGLPAVATMTLAGSHPQRQREAGLRLAMERLPAEQLRVLRLSFYEEQPHAQIARELGIPLGTVKSRV